ncbi:zinc finger protein 54-like isoform X1 [Xyrichtys novacula]|uniref:Zinc finger protein 54-like isoform X1 n=1 Tax=Xyrichtys novacula TaxID=13765 RepID=A0AAV1GPU6_XYRNO|nr:zinc finger protein 54-like isoform X1 [Xyrichtys novacula]
MATRCSLNSQLSYIMETMARTALSQVCKVVDEESAELRSEVYRLIAANSALSEKVNSLECELTVVKSDARKMCKSSRSVGVQTVDSTDGEPFVSESPTIEAIFGKDWCMNLWKDRDPICAEKVPTDPLKISDEPVTLLSDKTTTTEIKEEDFVEDIPSSFQQETPKTEDHGESLTEEPEHLSVGCSGGSSSCSFSLEQDGEKVVSEVPSIQLISVDNTEEALNSHIISIDDNNDDDDDDDDDDVQFIPESEKELVKNTGDSIYNKEQNSEDNAALNSGLHFGINMPNCQTFSETNRNIFKCEICDRTFFHKGTLTHHMKTHRENFCSICKQHFPHRYKFTKHACVPPHSSKSQSCELCGKAFANPSALRIHQVVHTGEKPYSCNFCGKGFTQKGNLNAHLRIHTGERPFCCLKCGKTFTQKINLKHHMMAHKKSEIFKTN